MLITTAGRGNQNIIICLTVSFRLLQDQGFLFSCKCKELLLLQFLEKLEIWADVWIPWVQGFIVTLLIFFYFIFEFCPD